MIASFAPMAMEIVELRQYTLHPGQRDTLIELFEREFIEAQEACGMHLPGQFRDVDDPDRFVWLRGFSDMETRRAALAGFYGGEVWASNRDAANATMIDSDDVLLLRPCTPFALPERTRPPAGAETPDSLVFITVCPLAAPIEAEFPDAPIAVLQTERARNTYPALPVREGETVLVWISGDEQRLTRSAIWPELRPRLTGPPRELRLRPTARSLL
jgi:NIPSNAP